MKLFQPFSELAEWENKIAVKMEEDRTYKLSNPEAAVLGVRIDEINAKIIRVNQLLREVSDELFDIASERN